MRTRLPLRSSRLTPVFIVWIGALLGAGPAAAQAPSPTVHGPSNETVQLSRLDPAVSPEVQTKVHQAFHGDDLKGKDGPMAKVGPDLATLYYQHKAEGTAGVKRLLGGKDGVQKTASARFHSPISPDGRSVTINAVASSTADRLLSDFQALGLKGGAKVGRLVSGQLPIQAIEEAAQLSSLRGTFLGYARTQVGSVGSQADTAHRAIEGRADLGVDGSGQKICALSDSYDNRDSETTVSQDAAQDILDGDLPGTGNPEGNTTPVDVLDDSEPGSDEGRAMLQLIHDIAPGAELGFHTAFGGLAGFVEGIVTLADPNNGNCSILVDDVGYSFEPFYQDGPVSNVADSVASEGVPYFSSAGNAGQNSYEAPFRNSRGEGATSEDDLLLHDFDPSTAVDTLQEINISVGGTFEIFSFQWTDPSAIVAGSAGADTDIDIILVNDTLGTVTESVEDNDQDGTGVPVESLGFTNDGSIDTDNDGVADSTFHFVIGKSDGPDPEEVKYIYDGGGFEIKEFNTLGPTIFGHPMAENAMAVAAAPYFYTEAYGFTDGPAGLESFSSKGGIQIRFDETGTPLASPEDRDKPDVTGADGINNTFFGDDIPDSDPHPNFFGTSAAAPNVAAIGALVMEANPGYTVTDLYDHLEANAEDVTTRESEEGTFESIASGFDPWSGHGFVKANAAALPVEVSSFEATAEGDVVLLTWSTGSETNNAGFAIEHKRADGSFDQIGFVEGAGTTTEPQSYRFRAPDLNVGTHAFRLLQTDLDGSTTLTKETTVDLSLSGAYKVSPVAPNPIRDDGTVSVTVQSGQTVRAAVYDVLGRRVAVLHDGPIAANDPATLRLGTNLQSGVYILRIDGESFSATRKFVRIR